MRFLPRAIGVCADEEQLVLQNRNGHALPAPLGASVALNNAIGCTLQPPADSFRFRAAGASQDDEAWSVDGTPLRPVDQSVGFGPYSRAERSRWRTMAASAPSGSLAAILAMISACSRKVTSSLPGQISRSVR
jgi:hypothetical protein